MKDQTRRAFLSATGIAAISSLAGCSVLQPDDTEDESEEPEEVDLGLNEGTDDPVIEGLEYPPGFSEEGIENFETALGQKSNYYNVSSVFIQLDLVKRENSEVTSRSELNIQSSGEQRIRKQDIIQDDSLVERQFQEENTVYSRSADSLDVKIRDVEYSKANLYLIPTLQNYLSGVSLSIDSIKESNLIYTASLEDIAISSVILEEFSPNLTSADIEFEITEEGLPVRLDIEVRQSSGETTFTGERSFDFSSYNVLTVDTPAWVEAVKEQNSNEEINGSEQ